MRPLRLVMIIVAAAPSIASAQVQYVSQVRTVRAGTAAYEAPDFEPFYQTPYWSVPVGSCVTGYPEWASASHSSQLTASGITCSLSATSHTVVTNADTRLTVMFLVPAGTAYSLTGLLRQYPAYGCADVLASLTGPGINFVAQPSCPGPPGRDTTISRSGVLLGGSYTLDIDAHTSGFCVLGTPPTVQAEAGATLSLTLARCRADADHNGSVEPADVAYFVQLWFGGLGDGTLEGDFDGNGVLQPADVAAFVQAWYDALVSGPC